MRKSLVVTELMLCLMLVTARLQAQSACISCHGDADFVGEESAKLVQDFGHDVHSQVGLSCESCHGGNPDASLAEDPEASMDERFAGNPFVGAPDRANIPRFCGRCHSDPTYMKRFKPDARVDQESEYWTSQHGQALRQGDTKVATCTDCHGVHGILHADDPRSTVYPINVAQTCRNCHGDAERMSGYTAPGGGPLRVDQYARWRQSVHASAMFDREDLTAPTCNDCHGNHGATPPGLESIAFVCGQCHGRESELFRRSAKHDALQLHNEFLADAEGEGCAACHEDKPRGELPISHSFGECSSCHGNHGIVRPNLTMLSPHPETPCAFCHEVSDTVLQEFPELQKSQEQYEQWKAILAQQGKQLGLTEDDLFDWMLDQALVLPTHTVAADLAEGEAPLLRPEFELLLQKFRIGKTFYTYGDPATNQLVRAPLVRCTHCHADEGSAGTELAEAYLSRIQELTALAGAAERSLLAARRAGIETREASLDVNKAVDTQISLAVLLHTFSKDEFTAKQEEGLGFARAALASGKEAHAELQTRRLGLGISLIFVLLVLVALAMKIREVSRREVERAET